jgi:hypothetical protein
MAKSRKQPLPSELLLRLYLILFLIKMNAIGRQETLRGQTTSIADPFNYSGHSRNMTMSMNTIDQACDHVKT